MAGDTSVGGSGRSLSSGLAAFAVGPHAFPPLARSRAVDAITDCVACLIAGAREPVASVLRQVVTLQQQGALLLTERARCAPADAALFHGAIGHALDYDDTNHPAYAHPSAVLVPALLALAERANATGEDLVTAYIVGFDVFGKLGRALNFAHYRRGWHTTATFGTLAATVAAARLLRLTPAQTRMAIGIAASAAGGLRVNFGTMVKPLHAGYAARNGVLAAQLAQAGMDASELALEHAYGYCEVFNSGIGYDRAPLEQWGEPLEILTPYGLALKPFPACGATHTSIEAALSLRAQIGDRTIRKATAYVAERAFAPLIHVVPHTPLEGKFSLHFCIAAALHYGVVNLDTFREEKIADPAIHALVDRIDMVADPSLPDPEEFPVRLEVQTTDGTSYERSVALAMGKPARWFTTQQMKDKFVDCTRHGITPGAAEGLFGALQALDTPAPVAVLLKALADAAVREHGDE